MPPFFFWSSCFSSGGVPVLTDSLLSAVPALFTTYNEGDVKRAPSTLTLWLTQAELGLPSKEYYEDEAALTVYREVIRKTLESIYHDLGEKVDSQLAEEVLRFETALARASLGGFVPVHFLLA